MIHNNEKGPNVIVSQIFVAPTDAVDLILAVENTPAVGTYRLTKHSGAKKTKQFSKNDFATGNDRIVEPLALVPDAIYSLTAHIFCYADGWEGMIKITVNGVEKYRRYVNQPAGEKPPSNIDVLAGVMLVVGGLPS